jgi:hypothetical protein
MVSSMSSTATTCGEPTTGRVLTMALVVDGASGLGQLEATDIGLEVVAAARPPNPTDATTPAATRSAIT